MCGSGEGVGGIITGLIVAAGILGFAFAEKHWGAHAVLPTPHAISAPATHVAIEARPLTLDIDVTNMRVSLDVSL